MLLQKGLSGQIIAILTNSFPLQVHEIRSTIMVRYKVNKTTQAIHQILNKLMREGMVQKNARAYRLSNEFILTLDKTVRAMKRNYFQSPASPFNVTKNKKKIFTVHSLVELDELWNQIVQEKMKENYKGKQIYAQTVPHAWFALTNIGEEVAMTAFLVKHLKGFYTLVTGSTLLDEWLARFYDLKKSHYLLNPHTYSQKFNHQIAILGEYVIESHYPAVLARRLDNLFITTKQLTQLYLQEFLAIVNEPCEIKLTLHHNQQRATKILNKIMLPFAQKS